MTGKNMSPLGFLMELLNVSVIDLSRSLNIERTSVSKWKSGNRSFGADSVYYKKTIEFLKSQNIGAKQNTLEHFFGNIFPDADSSNPCYLDDCITRFFGNSEIPTITNSIIQDCKNSLYNINVSVYRGIEGRKNAVSLLLDLAESLETPCEICIFESDQLEWACSDMKYMHSFVATLERLLNKGHKIEIVGLISKDFPVFRVLMRLFIPINFHENLKHYIATSHLDKKTLLSFYAIRGKILITGINADEKPVNMFTSVYRDALSVTEHLKLFDNFKNRYSTLRVTNKGIDKNAILHTIQETEFKKDPCYFVGKMLSFTTMNEQLFYEVLSENKLSKNDKDRCIAYYHAYRNSMKHNPIHHQGGYYLYLDDIMSFLAFDSIVQYELSCLASKVVTISRTQYLRHFADTADLISQNSNFKVILNLGIGPSIKDTWFKKNLWCTSFKVNQNAGSGKIMLCEEMLAINIFLNMYDEIWIKTPPELKDPAYVADLFRKISREEDV